MFYLHALDTHNTNFNHVFTLLDQATCTPEVIFQVLMHLLTSNKEKQSFINSILSQKGVCNIKVIGLLIEFVHERHILWNLLQNVTIKNEQSHFSWISPIQKDASCLIVFEEIYKISNTLNSFYSKFLIKKTQLLFRKHAFDCSPKADNNTCNIPLGICHRNWYIYAECEYRQLPSVARA